MASPQTENGYTRIANEVLEKILSSGFNKQELHVIFCIIRNTWGWKRKTHYMTSTYIAGLTGIEASNIRRVLRSLKKRGVLIEEKNKVGFQKDYHKWGGLKQPAKEGRINPPPGLKQPVRRVETTHNKERITKKGISNKRTQRKNEDKIEELNLQQILGGPR